MIFRFLSLIKRSIDAIKWIAANNKPIMAMQILTVLSTGFSSSVSDSTAYNNIVYILTTLGMIIFVIPLYMLFKNKNLFIISWITNTVFVQGYFLLLFEGSLLVLVSLFGFSIIASTISSLTYYFFFDIDSSKSKGELLKTFSICMLISFIIFVITRISKINGAILLSIYEFFIK